MCLVPVIHLSTIDFNDAASTTERPWRIHHCKKKKRIGIGIGIDSRIWPLHCIAVPRRAAHRIHIPSHRIPSHHIALIAGLGWEARWEARPAQRRPSLIAAPVVPPPAAAGLELVDCTAQQRQQRQNRQNRQNRTPIVDACTARVRNQQPDQTDRSYPSTQQRDQTNRPPDSNQTRTGLAT